MITDGFLRRSASAAPMAGDGFFRAVRHADAVQVIGLWLITGFAFTLRWFDPEIADLQWILALLAVWCLLTEGALFLRNDTLILRGKTAILFGFFAYVFLSPALGSLARLGAPPKGAATAVAASLLYLAVMMTAYSGTQAVKGRTAFLERFVVDLDERALLRIMLVCFIPTIILRVFLQDWSKVSGVIPGLLGIGSQPWAHSGFGDAKVVFSPIHWLYALVPAFSALCWVKARNTPVVRYSVVLVWLFVFPALMLQRSRGKLIATVVMVLAAMLLVARDRHSRRQLYLLFLCLIPVLAILANLLLLDRGVGRIASQVLEAGGITEEYEIRTDPRTLLEDNLYFFARSADVVPDKVPRRSALELYYYMAINPIPRVLWPGKPWMDQNYLGKIRPYYAAITIVGDMYVYGGWWHIILGGLVLGFALKRVDQFGKASDRPEAGRVAAYVFLILSLFNAIRALWSLIVSVYAVLTLLVILYLVRRQQATARGGRQAGV